MSSLKNKKPSFMEGIKQLLANATKEPTPEELKQKIEVTKLKAEYEQEQLKLKEAKNKRWSFGDFK